VPYFELMVRRWVSLPSSVMPASCPVGSAGYSLYYGGEKRDGTATLTPALGTNIYCGHGTMIGGPAIDQDASRDALHVLAAEHDLASLRVAANRASKEAR
jgi:hypothetical protein